MKKKFNIGLDSVEDTVESVTIKIDYSSVEAKIKDKLNVHLNKDMSDLFYEAVKANPGKVDIYLRYINLNDKEAFLNVLKANI